MTSLREETSLSVFRPLSNRTAQIRHRAAFTGFTATLGSACGHRERNDITPGGWNGLSRPPKCECERHAR